MVAATGSKWEAAQRRGRSNRAPAQRSAKDAGACSRDTVKRVRGVALIGKPQIATDISQGLDRPSFACLANARAVHILADADPR